MIGARTEALDDYIKNPLKRNEMSDSFSRTKMDGRRVDATLRNGVSRKVLWLGNDRGVEVKKRPIRTTLHAKHHVLCQL